MAVSGSSAAEQTLLERVEETLAQLAAFTPDDQQRIREVLAIVTSGQELDLQRFGGPATPLADGTSNTASSTPTRPIVSLRTDAELEDYTYRVAGCVGEFWTRMCRAHLFPESPWDDNFMLTHGVHFGQGLQLVNILRDLPVDLRKGRCYIPAESLATAGLVPVDLLQPQHEPKFRPLYQSLLARAQARLAAGWEYTLALPRGCARVRLACAWPILIGVRTLSRLRKQNVLEHRIRIKISRSELRSILLRSVVLYPFPSAWRRMFVRASGS